MDKHTSRVTLTTSENWSLIEYMDFNIVSSVSLSNWNFTSNSPEWDCASFWSCTIWSIFSRYTTLTIWVLHVLSFILPKTLYIISSSSSNFLKTFSEIKGINVNCFGCMHSWLGTFKLITATGSNISVSWLAIFHVIAFKRGIITWTWLIVEKNKDQILVLYQVD